MAIKKINYTGSSKILLRLCEAVNALIDGGGGGGSKHTIINASGTPLTDRAGLQFTGATVTDDSANDKTVVAIPTNLSDFTNDTNFITNTVSNLTNYYLKSETYTKSEVNTIVNALIPTIDSTLSTTSENPVQNKVITARLNEVFTSVSNGKTLIASAITGKGVPTDATDTFATMASNISDIPSGGAPKIMGGIFDIVPMGAIGGVGIGDMAMIVEIVQ